MARTTAIVVLTTDRQANTAASGLLRRHLEGMDVEVIAPEGLSPDGNHPVLPWRPEYRTDPEQRIEYHTGPVVETINQIIDGSLADWVHVYSAGLILAGGFKQVLQVASQSGRFCALGPVGTDLTGPQRVVIPDEVIARGFGASAAYATHADRSPMVVGADLLDARCFAIRRGAWGVVGPFDTSLGEGADLDGDLTWPLRDWLARARERHVYPAVARKILSGQSRTVRTNPHRLGHPADRVRYLQKHAPTTSAADHAVWACWTVLPQNRHQLALLAQSIASTAGKVGGIHLLLQGGPDGFDASPGPKPRSKAATACKPGPPAEQQKRLTAFVRSLVGPSIHIAVEIVEEARPEFHEVRQISSVRALGGTWRLAMLETELLDPACSREFLARLAAHPDPLVTTYDLATPVEWGAPGLHRVDAPYGDGGDLSGDGPGSHDWRLHRTNGGRHDAGGGRVANLRLINQGLVGQEVSGGRLDSMVLQQRNPATSIAAHFLAHEGEDPDDILRALDWLHGLADEVVMVWTGGSGPCVSLDAAAQHCSAVMDMEDPREGTTSTISWPMVAPMSGDDLDLASARNKALWRPDGTSRPQPSWHMFIDPDEWWTDPVAGLIGYRRAVESNDTHAYLAMARNLRPDGTWSESRSIRLWRADAGLRFVGRVHETLQPLEALQARYHGRALAHLHEVTSFWNLGYPDEETKAAKLDLYERLIRRQLAETPESVQHWVTLAAHYTDRGQAAEALECLDRACEHADGTQVGAWRARATLRCQLAAADLWESARRMPPGTPGRTEVVDLHDLLASKAGMLSVRQEDPPPLPGEADAQTGD